MRNQQAQEPVVHDNRGNQISANFKGSKLAQMAGREARV